MEPASHRAATASTTRLTAEAASRVQVYFSLDDIGTAAAAGDKAAAAAAWTRGKEYLDGYLRIVNLPISSKVGDKFEIVNVSI